MIPTRLTLDPNPGNVDELKFTWIAPAGHFSEVDITYSVAITGPSFNTTTITTQTFFIFNNNISLDCQAHFLSIFASNAAGSGPVATIEDYVSEIGSYPY